MKWGGFDRFRDGLKKSRDDFARKMQTLFTGKVKLDAETLDRIEELLISADMGVQSSVAIVKTIERRLREEGGEASIGSVMQVIRGDVRRILSEATPKVRPPQWGQGESADSGGKSKGKGKGKKGKKGKTAGGAPRDGSETAVADALAEPAAAGKPHVIFVVGVNGTGKTTSIAKLAHLLKEQGQSVLLAAGDTFRAAAVEQLQVWAERVGVPCISQGHGADPAAVVYDALGAAAARGVDVVIVDTAGRLHTKTNLMAELGKMERVIEKRTGRAPETLLVVDANTGQNGLQQARVFAETIPVDGLVLAKLDGTAKGGIVVAIAETLGLPVKYVGTGETLDDIAPFDTDAFVDALFAGWAPDEESEAAHT
ncbi:MAG: signal recognition particle-docking protein FtsY [Candidatus Krumholzibacteriia bacterium]